MPDVNPEMAADPIAVLRRWEDFGGTWTISERTEDSVTISLRRCDGGEEAQRLTSTDPALLTWLDRKPPSHSGSTSATF